MPQKCQVQNSRKTSQPQGFNKPPTVSSSGLIEMEIRCRLIFQQNVSTSQTLNPSEQKSTNNTTLKSTPQSSSVLFCENSKLLCFTVIKIVHLMFSLAE